MSPYRPAFEAALRLFAEASKAMRDTGHGRYFGDTILINASTHWPGG